MPEVMVEVFTQDVESSPVECAEAREIIERLGLKGQAKTTAANSTRLPFRVWNETEALTYQTLCPITTEVSRFDTDTIPLRVLKVLDAASALEVFEGFEVLHATRDKDPVLVGYLPSERYTGRRYLLARWGAELDEFPTMVQRAAKVRTEKALRTAREIAAKAEAFVRAWEKATPDISIKVPYTDL